MKKVVDIYNDLDIDISLSYLYNKWNIDNLQNKKYSTNDIFFNLKDIDISLKKNCFIKKNKTKNFDSFLKNSKYTVKKLKDINISQKLNIFQNIFLLLRWKSTLSWNKLPFFKTCYFSKKFFKNLILILLIIIFLWITFKYIIEDRIKSGYTKILSIKNNSWDINFIKKQINDAKLDFIISNILFKPFLLINNDNINNWYYILKWSIKLIKFLDKSLQSYSIIKEYINQKWGIDNINLTGLLTNLKPDILELKQLLYEAIISYKKIWYLDNSEYNKKILFTKNKLKQFYDFLNILEKDFDIFLDILWHNKEKTYLIVFQNNDEIRPSWWFIWSLATIKIQKWQIIDFIKDDIYSYEWQINKIDKNKKLAPEWLNKITKYFWFRDSNYFISFEKNSNKIKYFLDKIDKKIDWIIYINQNIIIDLLDIIWWVNFSKINTNITKDNFSLIISTLVEGKSFKVWTLDTPKQILFDFTDDFIKKIKNKKDYFWYLDILLKNIISRDLVFYSFNTQENNILWKLWLNWKINYSDTLDFAYPVYTSIWWNKSDRYIKIDYKKQIKKNKDCSIDTNLQINRWHLFSKIEEEKVINIINKFPNKDKTKKDLLNIQWKWNNISFTRIILPKNIEIKNRDWIKIIRYKKFTILQFYINTEVTQISNFNINYKIKNKDCKKYNFKLYKQAWISNYNIQIDNNQFKAIKKDFIYFK